MTYIQWGGYQMVEYFSIYAPYINQYIEFKRNLGYKYQVEYNFKDFDDFILFHGFNHIGLTRKEFELWAIKKANESDSNQYHRINYIKNFSIYLNQCGYKSFVPHQKYKYISNFVPYIFTKDEIKKFFNSCDNLNLGRYSNTTYVYPALFRLLYGCGLRVSEVLNLKIKHVNLSNSTIVIYDSKNGEDRIIPFSISVKDVLSKYLTKHKSTSSYKNFLFSKKDGNSMNTDIVYRWFRKILRYAEISHGGKGKGPRVHDFRHTFSVYSLATMAESGLDLYYSLPILSKYLGHKSLEATEKYVRLTVELYPEIMKDVNQLCSYVFPEVINNETY